MFGVVLGSVIVLAIPLLILLLAAWGLSKEKHSFLIPFIVVQFISLIFVITFFIASIAAVVMTNVITPPTPSPQSDVFLHGPNRTAIINLPGFEGLGENFPSFDRDEEQSFISGAWSVQSLPLHLFQGRLSSLQDLPESVCGSGIGGVYDCAAAKDLDGRGGDALLSLLPRSSRLARTRRPLPACPGATRLRSTATPWLRSETTLLTTPSRH